MESRRSTVFRGTGAGRPPSAVWLVRKPRGVTSASLVADFRAAHAGPWPLKVSHGGVLDPFAEGLVVLLVGAANRLFERLHEVPKRYVARVAWWRETTTGDAAGATQWVGEAPTATLTPSRLDEALGAFIGWTAQVPPSTSNKRVDGERAYAKAHRGEAVTLAAQQVYCDWARWAAHALPAHSTLELSVRGGFYVRSLAADLGRALGVGAHLETLERTAIGPWEPPAEPLQLTGRAVLPWLPSLELSDAEWGALRRGATAPSRAPHQAEWPLPAGFPAPGPWVRAFHRERLVALVGAGALVLLPGGV